MSIFSKIKRSKGDPKILRSGPSSLSSGDRLAKRLGWLGIGLGVAQLVAAGSITRALGMEGREGLVRAYGARELATGMLSLSTEKSLGLWGRVAGDGLDIATLAGELDRYNPKRANVAGALALVLGVSVLDLVAALATTARHRRSQGKQVSYRDRSGFPHGVKAARDAGNRAPAARSRPEPSRPVAFPAG
ncbi:MULTISPECIES: hypothetical protein [Rhodomicrobium]|uniref:hypothetical protein n=1 Tax=Rhodomicrobium TaxID=1068 RepID=UPI000B4A97A3|nr:MULTISPECIES: hypothetical protein [Rhodomicrobium]